MVPNVLAQSVTIVPSRATAEPTTSLAYAVLRAAPGPARVQPAPLAGAVALYTVPLV
jgi:hypothetical protein